MCSYIQLLGCESFDSSASLLLFFDNERYLINVPEGLQRLSTEHSIKMSKISHILLTKLNHRSAGGLPGLLITLADLGLNSLTLNGPNNTSQFLTATRNFSVRNNLIIKVNQVKHKEEILIQNNNVKITAIRIGEIKIKQNNKQINHSTNINNNNTNNNNDSNNRKRYTQSSPSRNDNSNKSHKSNHNNGKNSRTNSTNSSPMFQSLNIPYNHQSNRNLDDCCSFESHPDEPMQIDSHSNNNISNSTESNSHTHNIGNHSDTTGIVSYICTLSSIPGKFDMAKAKSLGLKPGPAFALLKAGQPAEISLKKGGTRIVQPEECVGPPIIGPSFSVVDCPLIELIDNLTENVLWQQYYNNNNEQSPLVCIIHLCPMQVLTDSRYIRWMNSFPTTTTHILVNSTLCPQYSIFRSSELNLQKLARINSGMFQYWPGESSSQYTERANELMKSLINQHKLPTNIVIGTSFMKFNLLPAPSQKIDSTSCMKPISDNEINELITEEMKVQIQQVKKEIEVKKSSIHNNNSGEDNSLNFNVLMDEYSKFPQKKQSEQSPIIVAQQPAQNSSNIDSEPLSISEIEPVEASVPQYTRRVIDPASLSTYPADPSYSEFKHDPSILKRLSEVNRESSPELLFIGTGSAIPSKYRNVTCIYLSPKHPHNINSGILLDCGEGSYSQLQRKFGPERATELIKNLKCIFISHMHADHHLGLLTVLSVYKRLKQLEPHYNEQKLLLIGPKRLYDWLNDYYNLAGEIEMQAEEQYVRQNRNETDSEVKMNDDNNKPLECSSIFDYVEFIHCLDVTDRFHPYQSYFSRNSGLSNFQTCIVRHCYDSYGVIIESISGWKVVYSGDTMPSQKLINTGVNATVLIHEATLEDSMIVEAINKRHSTTKQAVEVGLNMLSKSIVLTHFSQRYPKVPNFTGTNNSDLNTSNINNNIPTAYPSSNLLQSAYNRVSLAFDLMSISLSDLHWLPLLTPLFAQLFAEIEEENEEEKTKESDSSEPDPKEVRKLQYEKNIKLKAQQREKWAYLASNKQIGEK